MFSLYLFIRLAPYLELNIHTWLLIIRQMSFKPEEYAACCCCAWAMRCDGVGVLRQRAVECRRVRVQTRLSWTEWGFARFSGFNAARAGADRASMPKHSRYQSPHRCLCCTLFLPHWLRSFTLCVSLVLIFNFFFQLYKNPFILSLSLFFLLFYIGLYFHKLRNPWLKVDWDMWTRYAPCT